MSTLKAAGVAPSLVRTATPFVVGLVGSTVVDALGMDSGQINAVVAAVIGYGYYVAARFAEVFLNEKWGYVLGVPGAPVYKRAAE